jgi:hypothetical protein
MNLSIEEHNATVKTFNSFMNYVNKTVERFLMRYDDLPTSYFGENTEKDMDRLSALNTTETIYPNIDAIKKCHADLKNGFKGLKMAGRI